ncbi:CbiX/SirB N-terminal domain-containing protein [Albidovulum sp.]
MTRAALIVAHGQPSDPAPPEREMAALAQATAALMPGWQVRAATLAAPGALGRAAAGLDRPVVFPFFMADGWFIRTALPQRLAAAGIVASAIAPPFGLLPETQRLAIAILRGALAAAGWAAEATDLVLAAHGSGRSPYPARAAQAMAAAIARALPFAAVRTGFIEEAPPLAEAARAAGPRALCLPLFVARWGHVLSDLPEALAEAGFAGRLLDPIGVNEAVPGLIAAAVRATAAGRQAPA